MRSVARRRRTPSPETRAFGRQLWLGLVADAQAAAAAVLAGGVIGEHRQIVLRGQVKRARGAAIPVDGLSASHARAAFVAACDGFLVATPERRSVFAPLVIAAGELVDRLLVEAGSAAADRTWRRQFPEA
jgi:hypothetical protein